MPSAPITTTSVDTGSVALRDEQYRDETLNLASGVTVLPGTILARDSVSLKLVLFVKGGSTNQNGIPKAVLGYQLIGATGDNAVRTIEKGEVNKRRRSSPLTAPAPTSTTPCSTSCERSGSPRSTSRSSPRNSLRPRSRTRSDAATN
jgi:hypothetical protein